MQSVLDLPNLSSWYAQPKLPWDQFGKCKVGYEKAMYIFLNCVSFTKGQIISKRLFGILGFFQKTNKQIHF